MYTWWTQWEIFFLANHVFLLVCWPLPAISSLHSIPLVFRHHCHHFSATFLVTFPTCSHPNVSSLSIPPNLEAQPKQTCHAPRCAKLCSTRLLSIRHPFRLSLVPFDLPCPPPPGSGLHFFNHSISWQEALLDHVQVYCVFYFGLSVIWLMAGAFAPDPQKDPSKAKSLCFHQLCQ